jgi:hypothetical protein
MRAVRDLMPAMQDRLVWSVVMMSLMTLVFSEKHCKNLWVLVEGVVGVVKNVPSSTNARIGAMIILKLDRDSKLIINNKKNN